MKSFIVFRAETQAEKDAIFAIELFEHETYKLIPGSKNSYRTDPGNTNTMTLKHSHVYAKPKGRGKELYSVNIDGSGHDGSSGMQIPGSHADHFSSLGYTIGQDNILESIELSAMGAGSYELVLLDDA